MTKAKPKARRGAGSSIKVVILAGGLGTRISEESHLKPKPMVEVGGKPILWHILKIYSAFGFNDFVICCGYKGYVIKEYFANYFLHMSDVTFDMRSNRMQVHEHHAEPWRVTLVDTGEKTQTGGRLKRIRPYVEDDELFMLTYGDGLSDVDIPRLLRFHREERRLATVTAVQPPGRFGAVVVQDTHVARFMEKPQGDGGWISGGFFVASPRVLDYIDGDDTVWEREPLERLARESELSAYTHAGFFHPLDTLRDKILLDGLWSSGAAPWKVW
jgi:glucose-1-phosphate cytidylyltransferase